MGCAQALVPLKDLVLAKSRLAGLLRPSERRALAQAMAEDVLAVLSRHPEIAGVTLVSDDPGAAPLAARYGVTCWSERALGCAGLNAVVGCASARLLAAGAAPLLVMHADLPLLSAPDISAVLARQRALDALVVAPDHLGTGTNLLAFTRDTVPQFHFGADSCRRHLAWAERAGVRSAIVQRPGIALDVDEPADLAALLAALDGGTAAHTGALLRDTALGARVELALAGRSQQDTADNRVDTGTQD